MMRVLEPAGGGVAVVDAEPIPFADLYTRYADPVYRFCFSLVRDTADAEDVTANTFLAAYSAYGRVRPPSSEVRPWLFRIARNASIDQLRRRARRSRLLGVLRQGTSARAEVESVVMVRGDLREVVGALARLGSRDRELVGLRVAGELTFAEIGAVVGISEQAARTATRRALARLSAGLRGTS